MAPSDILWFPMSTFDVCSLSLFPFVAPVFLQGNADITDFMVLPADVQLASDYHSVSSASPPAKKAKDMHAVSNCLTFINCSNKVSHSEVLLLEWDSWPQVYCNLISTLAIFTKDTRGCSSLVQPNQFLHGFLLDVRPHVQSLKSG